MQPICASIVINTYNRALYVQRLLAGLSHLCGAEFEVVVVNGPSDDGTTSVLDGYQGQIKVVDCPTRNLSHSRNLGIAAAAGDIVVFIDDDALPADKSWLTDYMKAFGPSNVRIGGTGGFVWHRDTNKYEFHGGMTSDYGLQIFDQKMGTPVRGDDRWITGVRGCNCAFQRSALIKIGGFDEFFTYYLDETDVCFRIKRAGYAIEYLPRNGVRHYSATSERRISKYDRNWYEITRSDTYFALKNGADRLPVRIAKTLALAPRKHFFKEINSYLKHGEISFVHWLRLMSQWSMGLVEGLRAGVFEPRRVARFVNVPEPFLPFKPRLAERRLRIALLSQTIPGQSGYGGVGRYTFDLAQALHERGHEVHVICKDKRPLRPENVGFYVHGITPGEHAPKQLATDSPVLNKNLSYGLAVVRKLADLYAQGIEFDVVHASNWDAEAAALIRAQVYPTVLMLVSPLAQVAVAEGWRLDRDLQACIALDRWQIEHADAVSAPSDGVLGSYKTLMELDAAQLEHLYRVPLGIVPDLGPRVAQTAKRRKQLLFVGRLERRKGAHILLDALPKLLHAHADWECHLVGNDQVPMNDGSTLKERFLARHRGAPWLSRVVFHGQVDEQTLRRRYQECDLFVAPSLFESFGLIYHEAMQYGKAVIGCRTGGVAEVVEDGVEGLLVAPGDAHALRHALARLMSDDSLRQRMGEAGRRRIHERSNYRIMAVHMEQVYYETIDRVGAERRINRHAQWFRNLSLFPPAASIELTGTWVQREAHPGLTYLVGSPDAGIQFTTSGTRLWIETLRHRWSGVMQICIDGQLQHSIDLYKPDHIEYTNVHVIDLPGAAKEACVQLRVHTERNPASLASEVWLKRLAVV